MANVYFGDTIGVESENWNTSIKFTVSGITVVPSVGDTYTNNGVTFKVTVANFDSINAGGTGTSTASGTLTRVSGTGDATIAFSAKQDVNWFSEPGSQQPLSGDNIPGTPLGRLPTPADSVIVYNTISIGPDITPWPSNIFVDAIFYSDGSENGSYRQGSIMAGTYDGTIQWALGSILGGTIVCNGPVIALYEFYDLSITGGTFNGSVSAGDTNLFGGTFASTITTTNLQIGNNPVFNGTFISTGVFGSLTGGGIFKVVSGAPVFNCALPVNARIYQLTGGVYNQPLVLGLFEPNVSVSEITITGLSTSQNVTLNSKYSSLGFISITNSNFTGLLTINRNTQQLTISGGSYTPPAVTTPAVRSGNSMTFSSAALPIDPGFVLGGGTFNPTVLIAGTSNDIIGSGLP
jgi:hypothetical protein